MTILNNTVEKSHTSLQCVGNVKQKGIMNHFKRQSVFAIVIMCTGLLYSPVNMANNLCEHEATYAPTQYSGYKTTGQQRFDFWFDLPSTWRACDDAANRDGYFIRNEQWPEDVGVAVTGSHFSVCPPKGSTVTSFMFRDGVQGRRIDYYKHEGHESIRYERLGGYFALHVTAPEDWIKSHETVINFIAASLRPGLSSYGDESGVVDPPVPCDEDESE